MRFVIDLKNMYSLIKSDWSQNDFYEAEKRNQGRDRDNEKVEKKRVKKTKERKIEKNYAIITEGGGGGSEGEESDKPSKGICRCWTSRIVLPR